MRRRRTWGFEQVALQLLYGLRHALRPGRLPLGGGYAPAADRPAAVRHPQVATLLAADCLGYQVVLWSHQMHAGSQSRPLGRHRR